MKILKADQQMTVVRIDKGDEFSVGHLGSGSYGTNEDSAILTFKDPNTHAEIEIVVPKSSWAQMILDMTPEDSLEPKYIGKQTIK